MHSEIRDEFKKLFEKLNEIEFIPIHNMTGPRACRILKQYKKAYNAILVIEDVVDHEIYSKEENMIATDLAINFSCFKNYFYQLQDHCDKFKKEYVKSLEENKEELIALNDLWSNANATIED